MMHQCSIGELLAGKITATKHKALRYYMQPSKGLPEKVFLYVALRIICDLCFVIYIFLESCTRPCDMHLSLIVQTRSILGLPVSIHISPGYNVEVLWCQQSPRPRGYRSRFPQLDFYIPVRII